MSGRFADAVRWRQIAGRRQREQLAAREWPVLALHSRLLGGEPHPRWSVETAACQASTIGQLTTACATWFRDANEDDISNVGCWHFSNLTSALAMFGNSSEADTPIRRGRKTCARRPELICSTTGKSVECLGHDAAVNTAKSPARKNEFRKPVQSDLGRPVPACRNIPLPFPPKSMAISCCSGPIRGAYRDRHERWSGMRWTRERCARRAIAGRIFP